MINKSRTRIFTTRLLIAFCVAGLLSSAPLLGKTQTALTPGEHRLLRVHEVRSNPGHLPTRLEWSLAGHRGRPIEGVIPGTEGAEFDAYPSLFQDVDTGAPILVWSRHNGVDYDVAFTRFEGESWTAPVTLVSTPRDDIRPYAYSTPGGEFHLLWSWPADGGSFLYGRFRVDSGVSLMETERIIGTLGPRGDDQWVTPEGGLDDPGSGNNADGGAGFNCEEGEACPCDSDHGGSGTRCNGTDQSQEGATVCGTLSVVVGSGAKACILTRTADGWSLGTCQPSRGGAGKRELLQSLSRLQNTSCP